MSRFRSSLRRRVDILFKLLVILVLRLIEGSVRVIDLVVGPFQVIDLEVGPKRGGVDTDGRLLVGLGIVISVGVVSCTGALPTSKLFLGLSTVVIDPREISSGSSSSESSTTVLNLGGFLIFLYSTSSHVTSLLLKMDFDSGL